MLPNRERWLGAAVTARIFSRYGQSANPAAKPCYLKTPKSGVRDRFRAPVRAPERRASARKRTPARENL